MQIGCNDLQGADLSRRLLHGSVPNSARSVRFRRVQRLDHLQAGFWPKLVLPCVAVLALGAFASGSYNKAITGSALKPPYMLHEQQYQETPRSFSCLNGLN